MSKMIYQIYQDYNQYHKKQNKQTVKHEIICFLFTEHTF